MERSSDSFEGLLVPTQRPLSRFLARHEGRKGGNPGKPNGLVGAPCFDGTRDEVEKGPGA